MKRAISLIIILSMLLLSSCAATNVPGQIATTTLPVYEITKLLCTDTGITVTQIITENVSCLHDYTLQVHQMQAWEQAELRIISGAGLEDSFLGDILGDTECVIDASAGISLHCPDETEHTHHEHSHEVDPHYWLSPANAQKMVENIYNSLCEKYPANVATFSKNYDDLRIQLDELTAYGQEKLATLKCNNIITFHDGFSYLAEAYGLNILMTIEEESGSEASAGELIELCEIVNSYNLDAIFTEKNGSASAATIISRETGACIYQLDMAVSGESYFFAMRQNIDTLKEALG